MLLNLALLQDAYPRKVSLQPGPIKVKKLTHPEVSTWEGALVGDFNGDGESDLFVATKDQVFVMDMQGAVLRRPEKVWGPNPDGLNLSLVANVDSGRPDELFVGWRENLTNLNLAVYNQNLWELKRFQATGSVWKRPSGPVGDSNLQAVNVLDLHHDGRKQLVAKVGACYAKKPRGIVCFDWETGQLAWPPCYVAPHVAKTQFADLNHDGVTDILFGTASPCNGNQLDDGTDDSHSYLYALSGRGDVLWRRTTGTNYTSCEPLVADLNGTGTNEIVVRIGISEDFAEEVSKVVKYDLAGNVLARYTNVGACLLSLDVADLAGDGKRQILATDRAGWLHVLDSELRPTRKIQLVHPQYHTTNDWVRLYLDAVADLDSDGKPELVFRSSVVRFVSGLNPGAPQAEALIRFYDDNRVFVLSSTFQSLASYTVAEHWKVDPLCKLLVARLDRGRQGLLVLGPEALLLELSDSGIR